MITRPTLPPKSGYTERVDANGVPYYAPTQETQLRKAEQVKMENLSKALLGTPTDNMQAAEQFRRAVQMFAQSLTEDKAMEIAMVFDAWQPGKSYAVDDLVTYGTNGVGDPQLYKVIQAHTSQTDWLPDLTQSLYLAIGLDDAGYPVWSPPTGAHDAYNIGDITNYEGTLYESLIHGNTTVPGTDDRFWRVYEEVEV